MPTSRLSKTSRHDIPVIKCRAMKHRQIELSEPPMSATSKNRNLSAKEVNIVTVGGTNQQDIGGSKIDHNLTCPDSVDVSNPNWSDNTESASSSEAATNLMTRDRFVDMSQQACQIAIKDLMPSNDSNEHQLDVDIPETTLLHRVLVLTPELHKTFNPTIEEASQTAQTMSLVHSRQIPPDKAIFPIFRKLTTNRPPPSTPPEPASHDQLSMPTLPSLHLTSVPSLIEHYREQRRLDPVVFDERTSELKHGLVQAKVERGGEANLLSNEYTAELASRLDAEVIERWCVVRVHDTTDTAAESEEDFDEQESIAAFQVKQRAGHREDKQEISNAFTDDHNVAAITTTISRSTQTTIPEFFYDALPNIRNIDPTSASTAAPANKVNTNNNDNSHIQVISINLTRPLRHACTDPYETAVQIALDQLIQAARLADYEITETQHEDSHALGTRCFIGDADLTNLIDYDYENEHGHIIDGGDDSEGQDKDKDTDEAKATQFTKPTSITTVSASEKDKEEYENITDPAIATTVTVTITASDTETDTDTGTSTIEKSPLDDIINSLTALRVRQGESVSDELLRELEEMKARLLALPK